MKIPSIIILAALLVGCTSSHPKESLSADQATKLAIQLANAKAGITYHRQPFQDGHPAKFESGRWVWTQLAPGDLDATVELAANGSTNQVVVNQLSNILIY